MTTEQRLSELSKGLVCLVPKPNAEHTLTSHEYTNNMCDCEKLGILRLARLGIWAEKYAIPTFKDGHNWACSCCDSNDTVTTHCDEALAQLPKQGEE